MATAPIQSTQGSVSNLFPASSAAPSTPGLASASSTPQGNITQYPLQVIQGQVISQNNGVLLPNEGNQLLDPFANLLEAKINEASFPCVAVNEAGSQSLVLHYYPNVDVARIEATGRNSSSFTVIAVLTNNIYPSANETWRQGTLFPIVYNTLLNFCYDNSSPVTFQHPYYGTKTCYIQSWENNFVSKGPRDGVLLRMVLVETQVGSDIQQVIFQPDSLSKITTIGSAVDNQLSKTVQPPGLNPLQLFSSIAQSITNALNVPNQYVQAVGASVLSEAAIASNLVSAPQNVLRTLVSGSIGLVNSFSSILLNTVSQSTYFNGGNSILNSPIVNAAIAPFVPPVGPVSSLNSTPTTSRTIVQPIAELKAIYSAIYNINYNNSNNVYQFVDNAITMTNSFINYYNALNNVSCSQLISSLYIYLNQLVNTLNTIQSSNKQNGWSVQSYITTRGTTLIALANLLNNSIDNMLLLNGSLLENQYSIPENTTVYYYAV